MYLLGVANGTSKYMGLGKFWQDLEISETFLISLEVSFFSWFVFTFFESQNLLPKSLGLGFLTKISASRILPFATPFITRSIFLTNQPQLSISYTLADINMLNVQISQACGFYCKVCCQHFFLCVCLCITSAFIVCPV